MDSGWTIPGSFDRIWPLKGFTRHGQKFFGFRMFFDAQCAPYDFAGCGEATYLPLTPLPNVDQDGVGTLKWRLDRQGGRFRSPTVLTISYLHDPVSEKFTQAFLLILLILLLWLGTFRHLPGVQLAFWNMSWLLHIVPSCD